MDSRRRRCESPFRPACAGCSPELRDGCAERLALLGVLQAGGQNLLGAAESSGTQLQAAEIQDVERNDVSAADLAEHVLDGDRHVIEEQRRREPSFFDSHLLLFGAALHAEGALHQEGGELLVAHLGEDREQIGCSAIGDPHLLAVEDVVRAIRRKVGAGARGQGVGAGMWLGKGVGRQHLDVGELRQILALLLLVAEEEQRQRADTHVRGLPAGPGGVAREMLGHIATIMAVMSSLRAAELFGNHDGGEPQVRGFAHDRPSATPGFVMLYRLAVRLHFLGPELIHGAGDGEMLLAQVLRDEDFRPGRGPRSETSRRSRWEVRLLPWPYGFTHLLPAFLLPVQTAESRNCFRPDAGATARATRDRLHAAAEIPGCGPAPPGRPTVSA